LIALISCHCHDENAQAINGEYVGIFERDRQVADVEFTFDEETYQVNRESPKFPAICRGTYTVPGSSLTFDNEYLLFSRG